MNKNDLETPELENLLNRLIDAQLELKAKGLTLASYTWADDGHRLARVVDAKEKMTYVIVL